MQMLTFGGQGANQAVEDGAALGVLFRDISSSAEAPHRLALFEQVRHKRASRVQLLSSVRAGNEHLVNEDMKCFLEPGVARKFKIPFSRPDIVSMLTNGLLSSRDIRRACGS